MYDQATVTSVVATPHITSLNEQTVFLSVDGKSFAWNTTQEGPFQVGDTVMVILQPCGTNLIVPMDSGVAAVVHAN
jgi:hypothetical protein